jgi:hypothetical protein
VDGYILANLLLNISTCFCVQRFDIQYITKEMARWQV